MSRGWLVNDTLTCIPGTKTFWHDLLERVDGLEDKTCGYTPFDVLPGRIEKESRKSPPDYIVRNATFFRRLNLSCKTISLLQDNYTNDLRAGQLDVCNSSTITVFNSPFVYSQYLDVTSRKEVIPIGIDFDLFKPIDKKVDIQKELGILPDSILFVGANTAYPKGFDLMTDIINRSSLNFCLVMKDDYKTDNPRVRVFNSVPHSTLVKIYNACEILVCTSRMETLHLSGIEAAACGLPIVATNVGVYCNREPGKWGTVSEPGMFIQNIKKTMSNRSLYDPRSYFLNEGLDKKQTLDKWYFLIREAMQ